MSELHCLLCHTSWLYNPDVDGSVYGAVRAFKDHDCKPTDTLLSAIEQFD